jgi:DNA replication protein DnaC
MNMIEIERALRELRLSGIAETLSTRVMQAQAAQQPFLETFAAMLQDELDRRRSRLTERRFKRSGLDERPSLADFDWRFNPKLPRSACFELHTLKFIGEGANALIIGKPGTGKSHVAKAVAYQATLQGYDVRYVEADTEFARYGLASTTEQAEQLKGWIEPDLLVLDDLFLARRIADVSAELLQAIVHQRYKLRRSIVITSNRVVQDWGKYLGDATMATTILDRLMHRCATGHRAVPRSRHARAVPRRVQDRHGTGAPALGQVRHQPPGVRAGGGGDEPVALGGPAHAARERQPTEKERAAPSHQDGDAGDDVQGRAHHQPRQGLGAGDLGQ